MNFFNKAQKPAEGILMLKDFGDSKYYKISCDCSNDDHTIDMSIDIEVDEDFTKQIELNLYTTQTSDYWNKLVDWKVHEIDNFWLYSIVNSLHGFINGFFHRLKLTKNIWFDGYLEYSSHHILTRQQAINFAETIKSTIKEFDKK